MRKSFFLVIALVLLVSGVAYAATITANLEVTIPSYIFLSFSDAVAEQVVTATASDIEWTVPAGGPAAGKYAESSQYKLNVLSTAAWTLSITAPAQLEETTTSDKIDLFWRYGDGTSTPLSAVAAFADKTEAGTPTGATGFTRYMSFAVPYTWDQVAGTYDGTLTISATIP